MHLHYLESRAGPMFPLAPSSTFGIPAERTPLTPGNRRREDRREPDGPGSWEADADPARGGSALATRTGGTRMVALRPMRRKATAAAAILFWILTTLPQMQAQANPDSTIDIIARDAGCLAAEPPPEDPSDCDIEHFKWAVNLDNSHEDPSLTPPASYSPVLATGDETNADDVSLPDTVAPDRGYLVSVLANDGVGGLNDPEYKIGGTHFMLPDDAGDVVVELQPNPLPLLAVRVRVFHDNQLVNSEDDIPLEDGLGGVHVTLGDRVGEVTTDWFGNPICTEYEDLNDNGVFDLPGDDGGDE